MARVRLDKDGLINWVEQAVVDSAPDYLKAHQDAISREVYFHPRQTRRRNRTVVGSPRDVVDTERLKRSATIVYTPSGYRLVWRARYAGYVFRGVNGLPPKNWHNEANKEFSVTDKIKANLR